MRIATFALATLALALGAPAAWADDMQGLEMDVMEAGGTPNEASTKVLALPDEASDTAREHAQHGLDTANQAREDGHAFGDDTADAAREGHGDAGGDHGPPDDPGRP
jgi:hypothetical protein